ncbi:hypothetical protein EMPG_14785 [Blastomyces silverae]|uniref:Uncharacterized protein n=1 Tax=Blastomyces silverae TaxID=2060906 RepID=A0A0H1BFM0_9EURO|nr:hypothetical protein EMPG_14785 [Blastomyces silverae]
MLEWGVKGMEQERERMRMRMSPPGRMLRCSIRGVWIISLKVGWRGVWRVVRRKHSSAPWTASRFSSKLPTLNSPNTPLAGSVS